MLLPKTFLSVLLILLLISGCSRKERSLTDTATESAESFHFPSDTLNSDESLKPILSFEKTRYNFGSIRKKRKSHIEIIFPFINTGEVPLVILDATVSCGCLKADYPLDPIMPSAKGSIKVLIDLQNQSGEFSNSIIIKSNTEEQIDILRVWGTIK